MHDETFSHIVNCGHKEEVDASIIDTADTVTYDAAIKLRVVANRAIDFLEEFK